MFTVFFSPTIPFYDGIWSRFIFSPWLITWASSKPTMTSLFKHAGQDNILFVKHCTLSLAPTLTPSSQKFNQLHVFYQVGQLLQYRGGGRSSNMKNNDYLDGSVGGYILVKKK